MNENDVIPLVQKPHYLQTIVALCLANEPPDRYRPTEMGYMPLPRTRNRIGVISSLVSETLHLLFNDFVENLEMI